MKVRELPEFYDYLQVRVQNFYLMDRFLVEQSTQNIYYIIVMWFTYKTITCFTCKTMNANYTDMLDTYLMYWYETG
jgi:hypothetical protein